MKFLIVVVFVQLLMLGAGVCGAYVVYDSIKSGKELSISRTVAKHTTVLSPLYKPSEHTSEEQHKFEAAVKRTD